MAQPEGVIGPPRPYNLSIVPPSPPSINAIEMPRSVSHAEKAPSPAKKPKTASERRRRNLLILAGVVIIIVIVLVIWNPTVSSAATNIDRQVDFHAISYISGDQIKALITTKFSDVSSSALGNSANANSQVVTVEFASSTDFKSLYAGLKSWLNDTTSSLRQFGVRAMVMRHSPIQETFCTETGFMVACNTQSPLAGCPHDGQYGLACDRCATGLYGSECLACPVCTNARMRCDDGFTGSGQCTRCDDGYAGTDCANCATGYWGKQCLLCPVSCGSHGKCSDGKSGTGACICDQGWSGASCGTAA